MVENRTYNRLALAGVVSLAESGKAGRRVKGELADLSFGGAAIHSFHPVESGKEIDLRVVTRKHLKPVRATGRVRYSRPMRDFPSNSYMVGVEFLSVDHDAVDDVISEELKVKDRRNFRILQRRKKMREVMLVLKVLPIIAGITWFAWGMFGRIDESAAKESAYTDQVRQGVLYYLYNG